MTSNPRSGMKEQPSFVGKTRESRDIARTQSFVSSPRLDISALTLHRSSPGSQHASPVHLVTHFLPAYLTQEWLVRCSGLPCIALKSDRSVRALHLIHCISVYQELANVTTNFGLRRKLTKMKLNLRTTPWCNQIQVCVGYMGGKYTLSGAKTSRAIKAAPSTAESSPRSAITIRLAPCGSASR